VRTVTLVVTNIIKIGGLYVGVHAALAVTPNPITLAFAAFMMAGAQVSETAIMTFIERFFGVDKGADQK
jgi:hypothetical protein